MIKCAKSFKQNSHYNSIAIDITPRFNANLNFSRRALDLAAKVKCSIMSLLQSSYIHWLTHFKKKALLHKKWNFQHRIQCVEFTTKKSSLQLRISSVNVTISTGNQRNPLWETSFLVQKCGHIHSRDVVRITSSILDGEFCMLQSSSSYMFAEFLSTTLQSELIEKS